MHKVIKALLARQPVKDADDWIDLWQKLNRGKLEKIQVTALLSSLSTRLPERETLLALVGSLRHEHRNTDERPWPGTVNVVGSGGGPRTFNISTAASIVAASMGVPVIKSGSRSYTSSLGSFDLLDLLGIQRSSSLAQTESDLQRHNISFTGVFVYPTEFAALTREIGYLEQRSYGRFFNALGPFLAQLPIAGQLTGVSDAMCWDSMSDLATESGHRTIWLCRNELGVDELLGFTDNTVKQFHSGQRHTTDLTLHAGELTDGHGELSDLAPPHRKDQASHFLSLIAGEGNPAALETVLVNASALAVLSGRYKEWPEAMESARRSVDEGQARSLVTRLSEQAQGKLQRSRGGQ